MSAERAVPSPDLVAEIASECGFQIVDVAELPARQPRYQPVPDDLEAGVRAVLSAKYPNGLYSHQAAAIHSALAGEDVCLATSTASGKSLVFMSVAADLLRRCPAAKVLALYPARALIQDQLEKWRSILDPLGLRIGYIDGSVSPEARAEILRTNSVILMTPDVAHAWLLSCLSNSDVRDFLASLQLLILDEAHVYDGVFGTNMAYFLRRLQVAAKRFRTIASTATLGSPADFMQQLTGRRYRTFDADDDGSATPQRTVLLARPTDSKGFEKTADLLRRLATMRQGRFLAFGDSRGMVERLVAASHRVHDDESDALEDEVSGDEDDRSEHDARTSAVQRVLPYRAGYESEDRNDIQKALVTGDLAGVVSTSAMELGLDIGEIDLTVLLNVPASAKAFWQRLGRTGRRNRGVCLMIDARGALSRRPGQLNEYLSRPMEPSWLYLDNRYLQYANALCAAAELRQAGNAGTAPFDSLPDSFRRFLENEISPAEVVPPDLYPLKQRAQGGPHREFPMRSGVEQSFQVKDRFGRSLGQLTYSQVLREAYPGAIYYYMARPYRVYRYRYRDGALAVRREKNWTTRPLAQAMVFPRFPVGLLGLWRSTEGFVAEVEMQVSERVLGFTERRGSVKEEHRYGPTSPYHQRELSRFFETTGVCWCFPVRLTISEATATRIMEAYCAECGVQVRDVGVGVFHARLSPLGAEKCQGMCIFDTTAGSLRLTQHLAERFPDVVAAAFALQSPDDQPNVRAELAELAELGRALRPEAVSEKSSSPVSPDFNWVEVITPGQRAMLRSGSEAGEVVVLGHRHTPQGLMYELVPRHAGVKWMVAANQVEPLYGETATLRVNLAAGDVGATV